MSQKLLIRAPNHLGDCVMALPMINEAREAYPGAEITVMMPEHLTELFHSNPGVDYLIPIPTKHVHGLIAVYKVKELIEPHNFDVGYILPPSFGAASSFKLAGVPERIGYIADGRRMLLSRPLPLPTPLNSEHRSKIYFDLLRRASGKEIEYVKPKLFLDQEDSEHARSLLDGFDMAPDDPYVVIAFRAVAESRRWGTDNYTELARKLVEDLGYYVLLVGSNADRETGDEISVHAGITSVINLAGKTSLRELASICSLARAFVGNDSGPAHLAASVGIPVVIISGADDPKETSPISNKKRMLYADHLDCISCVKNKCPKSKDAFMRCMKDISVDSVYAQVVDALDNK